MRVAFITFVAVCTILAIGGGKKQGIFADAQGKSDRYNTSLPNVKKVKKNYSFSFIKNERKVKLIPTFLPQYCLVVVNHQQVKSMSFTFSLWRVTEHH